MLEMLPDGLRVVRRVRAARHDAFDAWVNPHRLRTWFGPPGTEVVAVDGELEVGHAYRLRIRHEDGHHDDLVWSFYEIAPPDRLVFGWCIRPSGGSSEPIARGSESVVEIIFRDSGGFTEIELLHTGVLTDQERQMFAVGWEGCFAGLEAILHQMG